MGNGISGEKHLSGSYAELWYNGVKIAEFNKISVKVTVNREEVQIGLDVDTKITGLKGEGTVSLIKTYSRFEEVRKQILKGKDPRGTMITKLQDPDAHNRQVERYQISNVALNEFGFEYEKGAVVKQEVPFGFTPSNMINLDEIKA